MEDQQIVNVARRILNGSTGIVAGARELSRLRHPSHEKTDEDILVFVGIDSETDDLPLGDARRYWNAEALKKTDAELTEYEARVREQALQACRNLISRYAPKA